jgi:CheY-like chemotaxis protein
MQAAETLIREIAQLRQFCRAVMNDQLYGDEVARALLQNVDLDGILAAPEDSRRNRLFSEALTVWTAAREHTAAVNFSDEALLSSAVPAAGIGEQILILTDVMGISIRDAALALDLDASEARKIANQSREGLQGDVHGNVMIVEDEPLIAEGIADLVRSMGVEVVAMARSSNQAIEQAGLHHPDAVLADFDLGGGDTGLDAVKAISEDQNTVSIFITAFPDEVLTGEDYEPAFVLAKPYRERALRTALAYSLKAPRLEVIE